MPTHFEEQVRRRANDRCEYCQFPQELDAFTHEIDHIVSRKHHGRTILANLALACFPCNNHKGPNVAGIDPVTGKVTNLFHPRRHKWHRHFRWDGPYLLGMTPIGRTTIDVLNINDEERVRLRQTLREEGVFPPDS